jgi:DNA helicase-2/ATP-dependent DNA helicase PcrA
MTDARIIAGLDDDQRAAATAPAGPVCVIAGPGSGKTRTVVARIGVLASSIDPEEMLALTHTTKAAGELRERIVANGTTGVRASTIHSAAWRQVRSQWATAGYAGEPRLVGSSWGMVKDAATRVLGRAAATSDATSELAGEIDWAAAHLLDPGAYREAARTHNRVTSLSADRVAEVWRAYLDAKAASGVLDFADVLAVATAMARGGLGVRPRALFVDEYQDVDRSQQALIDAWLDEHQIITAVGDSEQAIFGFKGGDPTLLASFAERYPAARVVHLGANYRSTQPIVEWVNRLTVTARPALRSIPGPGPDARVVDAFDEAREERELVSQLQRWQRDGLAWNDMAVLYRYNAASARLEAALAHAGIPYHVAGNQKFFDRPEIRAVLVPFGQRARQDPGSDGRALLEACAHDIGWSDTPPDGMGPPRQRWEAVASLLDSTRRLPNASAGELLDELLHRAREAHDLTPGGATLATLHAAKGLEWEAVWVAGVAEGQIPSAYASTRSQLDEEQHLLYVGVSRARRHLVVSHARKRHNGWRAEPSRYLTLLQATGPDRPASSRSTTSRSTTSRSTTSRHAAGAAKVTAPDRPRAECAKCRGRLVGAAARSSKRCSGPCLGGVPAERWRALLAWRDERAAALQVDAAKVATDKALFTTAVTGTTEQVAGWSRSAGTPPI